MNQCLAAGITSAQTNDHKSWQLYRQLQRDGLVPIRVFLTPDHDELQQQDGMPAANTTDGLLSCHRVKLFADGSLGAETAALRRPYRNTCNRGVLIETDDDMKLKIQQAHDRGYRLEIHAIGDRAAEQVLKAIEHSSLEPKDRPILTHCQVLGPDLIPKMAHLGVVGNIQPSFTITDASWAAKRLEDEVQKYS